MKKLDEFCFTLFLISLFLFKIPNLYFLPFHNAFFTTQALARVFILMTFLFNVFKYYIEHKMIFHEENQKIVTFLIICFFAIQSISIFSAMNTVSFLSRYKDIIVSLTFLFIFYVYKKNIKKIVPVFFIAAAINGIYQYFLVFQSDIFRNFISNFIYQKHLVFVLANLDRGRIYADIYDEITIPLFFIWIFKSNIKKNLIYYLLFISTLFFSFVSNFRTRILMFVFAFLSSILFYKKLNLLKSTFFFTSILVMGYIVTILMSLIFRFSFYDRLLNTGEPEEIRPLNSRLTQIALSSEMAKTNFFGVGLGNYYDNLSLKNKNFITSDSVKQINIGAEEYVHNIFGMTLAESGYLSLFIFLIIMSIFLKNDISLLKNGNDYKKAFVISFWTLFIYGFLNPIVPTSYQVLFWGFRGLLL